MMMMNIFLLIEKYIVDRIVILHFKIVFCFYFVLTFHVLCFIFILSYGLHAQ